MTEVEDEDAQKLELSETRKERGSGGSVVNAPASEHQLPVSKQVLQRFTNLDCG
jgi:hypothetical protein